MCSCDYSSNDLRFPISFSFFQWLVFQVKGFGFELESKLMVIYRITDVYFKRSFGYFDIFDLETCDSFSHSV